MALPDSRHNVTNPRWASTTGYVLDPNAVEPPGPQKDTGWQPGVDVPVGEWWNWLHQQAFLFFAYLESWFAKALPTNHIMRNAKGSAAGTITAGAGLSVNVTALRAWVEGAMYEAPAATNLALAAADPTNPRLDRVVIRVTGGVPAFAIVTGTPAASPALPAVASNEVAVGSVRVNAAAVVPGTITDGRIFGAMELDELDADRTFRAGDLGGGNWLLEVDDDAVVGGRVTIAPVSGLVNIGNSTLIVLPGTQQVSIVPEGVQFSAAIRRKFDLPRAAFTETSDVDRLSLGGQEAFVDTGATPFVRAPVRIPNGGVITAVRVYGYRATNTPGFLTTLVAINKGTGAGTNVASDNNAGSGPVNNFTQQIAGLSHDVDQSQVYELTIVWSGASGDLGLRAAEVEWEESKPFDGI
jgi:hypothetical protein